MTGTTIALLIVAVVVAWLMFWVAIVRLIARLGGWRRLAESYPCDWAAFEGHTFRMQSARLRWGVAYSNCLTFTVNREGLRIAPMAMFKFGHKPVLLPWGEIDAEPATLLMMKVVRLTPRRLPEISITISAALAAKLATAAGEQWPEERSHQTAT